MCLVAKSEIRIETRFPFWSLTKTTLSIWGKDEKLRLTNLEWGVDFLRLTNLVKTSLDGQI